MDRITVLYLIDVFKEIAGAERNLYEVATRLNKEKFRPIVMCMQGGYLVQSLRDKGIEANDLGIKKIYTLGAVLKAIKIFKLIKKEKVDIVVTYHESSDFFGSIIAKLAKVPVIMSSRRDMGYKLKPRHIFIYKLINRLFDRIITVSEAVANIIFDRENVLWSRIKIIHNGVEIEKFNKKIDTAVVKKSIGIDNNWPVVGILAAIRPIKGHKYFLEAAYLILKNASNINFLVVGWYDENSEYFKELQKLLEKLGIKDKVMFTGGRKDIPEMLSIMDICVNSSLNEGFPNAVLEAMTMGKPVVATNSGGTPEAVIDGKTGFLVDSCDSSALAEAINKLLKDNNLCTSMGIVGKERIKDTFKIEKMITEIESIYHQLILTKLHKRSILIYQNQKQLIYAGIRITKGILSCFICYSGLLLLLETLNRGKGIKVLAYHRINDELFDPLNLNIKTENFEKQIRLLKQKFNIVSFEKAVDMIQNKDSIPKNTIVVTFDDGFADNYINAFPLLNKYGVPVTIFLCVEAVNSQQVLWFQQIINAFYQTSKKTLELEIGGKLREFRISSITQKYHIAREIVLLSKKLLLPKRRQLVEQILSKLEINLKDIELNNEMLKWTQVREMDQKGITFGSHGMGHSILTKLGEPELFKEIHDSREIIERELDKKIIYFAYPNGGNEDLNKNIKNMIREAGYVSACTLIQGYNKKYDDLFEVKRFCVTTGMSNNINNKFSIGLFHAELAGVFDLFRKKISVANLEIKKS